MHNKDRFSEVRTRMTDKYNIGFVEYRRIHQWIKYHYGKPQACENPECKKISKVYDWALKRGYKYEKKKENFMRLCRGCHIAYDCTDEKREKLKKFHNATTKKQCLDCKQEFDLKFSQTLCEECGKERQRELFRQYSKKFPEIQKMRQSSYQKRNKDKVNAYQRNRRKRLKMGLLNS